MQSFLHDDNTTNTFVTRAALLPARTRPRAIFATTPAMSTPRSSASTATPDGFCIPAASHLRVYVDTRSSLSSCQQLRLRYSRGLCFVFLYISVSFYQAARGYSYTEARFHAAMLDRYAERNNDMTFQLTLLRTLTLLLLWNLMEVKSCATQTRPTLALNNGKSGRL